MSNITAQASFNGGEWAPSLFARVDLAKYRSGAALLENFFVDYRGGASTRPGTKYILRCLKNTAVRLLPFQASFTVGYIIEAGDGYMRFYFNGAPVLEATKAITGATNANPGVITVVAHGYATGEWIFISGVGGMTQLNGRYFTVTVLTANTFTLRDLNGLVIDTTAFGVYTAGGVTARVYTIVTPYTAAELPLLKFAQNISTMIICHPNHPPYTLVLVAVTNWTLTPIVFATSAASPPGLTFTTSLAAGAVNYSYAVTSVDTNGQESIPSYLAIPNLQDLRAVAGTIQVSWGVAAGAVGYNVYKSGVSYVGPVLSGQSLGFIGSTTGASFVDSNVAPDFSQTPPIAMNPFAGGINPSVPAFFQQRLILAAPALYPQTFYMSQPGTNYNFNLSSPVEADNAITGTLVSGQLNTIKSMISQTAGLLMLTDRASWIINGGGNGTAITPTALVANAQSFNGVSDVPPIVANFDVLYVQSKGSIVRDSAYNIYANVFTGTDISVLASHLFYGFQVLEWAWAEEPFKVVWAIRNDGVMLTLTFLKEQEFIGWAHSVTLGQFRSVATVTENTATAGNVDAVYTVVDRIVGGNPVKYIERFAERAFSGSVANAWCVDAGLQYVGSPATTFLGGEHLNGITCTGLADGVIIPPFSMPPSGAFTLSTPASKVTVGIAFTAKLQTLALELGEQMVQGKVKKIPSVDVRVADTLGLQIGYDFSHLVPMKDLVQGNVSSTLTGQQTQTITDLVNGDARTFLSPAYTVPGQYCIQQANPFPASVLGVFPAVVVGDTPERQR